MYENYSKQALPSKEYRELLGSAICVFNSNNSFVMENVLRTDEDISTWYELIDKESGKLKKFVQQTITSSCGDLQIEELFDEIIKMRNRIIHSYQITAKDGEQMLATKELVKDGNTQFIITEEYLLCFIKKNEQLSSFLHSYRGY